MALHNGVVLFILVLGFVIWKATSRRSSSSAPFPPGPPGDPIIGHVRLIPTSRPELAYQNWGKEYKSDVIYVNLMGQPAVILNSAQAAVDLMDKRSSIYSERPDFHFFEESGWRDSVTCMKTGPAFRKHRRMFQNAFSPTNIVPYRKTQEDLARALVSQIIQAPDDWNRLITRFASSIVLGIAYGIRISRDDDPYIVLADKIGWLFSHGGSPGQTLVDILPIIRYLPSWVTFIPSLKFARDSIPIVTEFTEVPFAAVKRGMANGTPEISFARKMLEEKRSLGSEGLERDGRAADITEDDIKGAAATIYSAGADTTAATLNVFVLCMMLNPEVQEKGRQELDRVIGRDRLPNLSDRESLPAIDRIFYETSRWHPVVPLGVPHKSSKDDVYKNMFIPGGSLVLANAHAITHDEAVYANPDLFNPDRYIPASENGAGEPFPVSQFGFGRRICPGQHLGSASVWMAIATILATMKISKPIDEKGNEITPVVVMSTGLERPVLIIFMGNSHPEPYQCMIRPRDEKAVEVVRQLK